MTSISILIFDDQNHIAQGIAQKTQGALGNAAVETASSTDFKELVGLLNRRRSTWRQNGVGCSKNRIGSHDVDSIDVIVVDYDLLAYSDSGDTTGSRLAYLLRCFSSCGLIAVLNERGSNTFDAGLGSPPEGYADIYIGDVQISNQGLWQEHAEGYRPWHWPVIPHARENFEKCVLEVQANLDASIIEFLGLSEVVDWIPAKAREFLAGKDKMEEVTFSNFVRSSHGGIDIKDELIDEQVARVAAARIVKFLNSVILPGQNVLVDAPHLASRLPSLIKDDRGDIDTWNRLCHPAGQGVRELLSERLNEYEFKKSHWLYRPAWFWPQVFKDEAIAEVSDPWTVEQFDWVFCENMSKYCSMAEAEEFNAFVSPPFIKRFVCRNEYQDADHQSTNIDSRSPQDPSLVEYVPQATFSQ